MHPSSGTTPIWAQQPGSMEQTLWPTEIIQSCSSHIIPCRGFKAPIPPNSSTANHHRTSAHSQNIYSRKGYRRGQSWCNREVTSLYPRKWLSSAQSSEGEALEYLQTHPGHTNVQEFRQNQTSAAPPPPRLLIAFCWREV